MKGVCEARGGSLLRRRAVLLALLAAAAASCTSRSPEQPPGPPPALVVTLQAVRNDRGAEAPFSVADRARAGDQIAFYVTPRRDAHIGIVQFYADGTRAVLFPDSGPTREVISGSSTRVPPRGQWLEIYGSPGEEHVFVVATVASLERSDPELFSLVTEARATPAPDDSASSSSMALPSPSAPPPGASGTQAHAPSSAPAPRPAPQRLTVTNSTPAGPHAPPLQGQAAPPATAPPTEPRYAAGMKGFALRSGDLRALKLVGAPAATYEARGAGGDVVVLHFAFQHVAEGAP